MSPKEKVGEARLASSDDARVDVKSQIALTLIDAMERGATPWQRPWNAQAMRPMNPTSNNGYRGINRILLALSGRTDPRWMTYHRPARKIGRCARARKALR